MSPEPLAVSLLAAFEERFRFVEPPELATDILEDSGGAARVGVCTDSTSGKGSNERAAVAAAPEGAATDAEDVRR